LISRINSFRGNVTARTWRGLYSPFLRLYWDRAHRPVVLGFVHGFRRDHAFRRDHRNDAVRSRCGCDGRVSETWFHGHDVRTGYNAERSREGTRSRTRRFNREGESLVGSRRNKSARTGGEKSVEVLADAVNVGIVKPRLGSMGSGKVPASSDEKAAAEFSFLDAFTVRNEPKVPGLGITHRSRVQRSGHRKVS